MLDIFNQILSLFILLLIGYAASKFKIITKEMTNNLSKLLINISLPAMIVSSMMVEFTKEKMQNSILMIVISIIIYSFSTLLALIFIKIFKKDSNRGIYGFIIMFSNVGFMGYPIVDAVLGSEAIFYTSIFNLPFNLLIFTLGVYFLNMGNEKKTKFDFKALNNPGVIAVFIGLIFFILPLKIPYFIKEPLTLIGDTTTPISMLTIGAILANVPIRNAFNNYKIYIVSFIRLVVLPIIVLIALRPFLDNRLLLGIPVIIASMPAAANVAILAKEYNKDAELASLFIFTSTFISIITIPIISSMI